MEESQRSNEPALQSERRRVLVVEDDEGLRRAYARTLERSGQRVRQVGSGQEALEAIAEADFDAIVCDINMPEMSGMQLLRLVRQRDLDVPFVIVTANPSMETALEAIEYGVFRYLMKPVATDVLVDTVKTAVRLRSMAQLKREVASYLGVKDKQVGDRAGLESSFERALSGLWMAYQPLVDMKQKRIAAFEALVRTKEPTLPNPGALLSAAERLDRVHDLGRAIRASIGRACAEEPSSADIFINLHPYDIGDDALFSNDCPLAPFRERIVLEVTERAALGDCREVPERIRNLRSLGYRVAIDDLGAGYAGLSYFALLSPEVVKLDISLIRNIHLEPVKKKLVASMTALCKDLGLLVVAEGIETAEECEIVIELGCDLLQGYHFSRPAPPFPTVNWEAIDGRLPTVGAKL